MSYDHGISIVIPLYNKVNHIRRCIDSVHGQSYGDYEIVVVDDGSTDASATVASEHLRSIDKLIVQSNQGPGVARHSGIKNSRHDLIAFLDADDAWLPGHLKTLAMLVERFGAAEVFGTGYALVRGPGKVGFTVQSSQDRLVKIGEYFKHARPFSLLHSSNSMVRKSVFSRIGGYPTTYRRGEDSVFVARLATQASIALANEVTAVVHLDAENRSIEVRRQFITGPWFESELFEHFQKMDRAGHERQWLEEYMASSLLHQAYYFITSGQMEIARCYLKSRCVKELRLERHAACLMLLSRSPRSVVWLVRMLRRAKLALLGRKVGEGVVVKMHRGLAS